MWYGFGRMFIEGFRTDSLYIHGTGLRVSQCLGLACFVVGTAMFITFAILSDRKKKLAAEGAAAEELAAEDVAAEDVVVDDVVTDDVFADEEPVENTDSADNEPVEDEEKG